jgi:hypothetical protein
MAESTQASPARKARDTNWTREEIHALVDAYNAVCGDNRGYGQKTNLNWTEIVKRMAANGVVKGREQARQKFKHLKGQYNKVKGAMGHTGNGAADVAAVRFEHFDLMDRCCLASKERSPGAHGPAEVCARHAGCSGVDPSARPSAEKTGASYESAA